VIGRGFLHLGVDGEGMERQQRGGGNDLNTHGFPSDRCHVGVTGRAEYAATRARAVLAERRMTGPLAKNASVE
jgi:hypothetical protein